MDTGRDLDRRTVLKTTGGLVAGVSMLAEPVMAAHPLGTISVDVMQEALNPDENGVIPVKVMFQSNPSYLSFTEDVFMGVGEAFETAEEGELVHITDEYEDGVANPARVADFGNPHDTLHGKLMHFDNEDIRYPKPDNWDRTLGVGVFPHGVDGYVPDDSWDFDSVRIPPRGRDN